MATKFVYSACNTHCGGCCPVKFHVENGEVTRMEPDDSIEPQSRACLRGWAYRRRVYAPDRLLYPLRRIGERGEGKFERVTWDEALDKIAAEYSRIKNTFGAASIIFRGGGGDLNGMHGRLPVLRAFLMAGGCTVTWGSLSFEGANFSSLVTYGTERATSHTLDDLLNSRLIIMWGWNPAVTIHRSNSAYILALAHEKKIPIVSVDPRFTESAATVADRWIPIRPGTDAAMLVAIAYVILTENLFDAKFLERHTIGFDIFRDYVVGKEDGLPKTPEWASGITGVPADTIASLAREYALTKPAALMVGIAPGRTAYGEQYHRIATTLAAMTGNVGISGGSAGERTHEGDYWGTPFDPGTSQTPGRMSMPANVTEKDNPPRGRPGPLYGVSTKVNTGLIADAVLKGRSGGYWSDYKMLWMMNCNYLNQTMDIHKTIQALLQLEFVVVQEQFMTPTAKFADIVLPVDTFMERNDYTSGGITPFFTLVNKAIEPRGESVSHFELGSRLAAKLGITDFSDTDEIGWVRRVADGYSQVYGAPGYDELKHLKIYRAKQDKPFVAFSKQITDPEKNPFETPSGKIEIYSELLAAKNDPLMPPVPKYIETWESLNDPIAAKYPLQLITSHFKRRAHSQFDNIPVLRELEEQALLISNVDAAVRGIAEGQQVRIFNDRGETVVRASLSEKIMPGVVDLPEGAWYQPDSSGIDRAGSCNVLTRNVISPGGALPSNTVLVQVEKYGK